MYPFLDQNVESDSNMSGGERQIDDIDRALLTGLVADGRISLTDLAEQVNVSRSTVHARVQRLHGSGVITRFTAVVDPVAVGLTVAAVLLVDIDQHDWRDVRDRLLAIAGVEYLAMCAGRFDLMMIVRAASIGDLRDVVLDEVQRLPGVRGTETILILDEART